MLSTKLGNIFDSIYDQHEDFSISLFTYFIECDILNDMMLLLHLLKNAYDHKDKTINILENMNETLSKNIL